jgi:hypothetical protein
LEISKLEPAPLGSIPSPRDESIWACIAESSPYYDIAVMLISGEFALATAPKPVPIQMIT